MIQYFFFFSLVLCNICLFIVCRASFFPSFFIPNTFTRKKNRIYIFLSIYFFACLSTMHVLNRKNFPSLFFLSSSSFFRFHFSCRVRANTQKCLETTCVFQGAHITHDKWGKRHSIERYLFAIFQ